MEEEEKKMTEVITRLTKTNETWAKIKEFLENEIRADQDIIKFIDEKICEKEKHFSKLN